MELDMLGDFSEFKQQRQRFEYTDNDNKNCEAAFAINALFSLTVAF